MLVEFDYYLNDHYDTMERNDYISEQTGIPITGDLAIKFGNPFYEIHLRCSLDTETGEVKLLKAEL